MAGFTAPVTRPTGYVVLAADWNNEHVNDLNYLYGYRTTTTVDPTNTVAETDLLNSAITIAAGILGTQGGIRLTAFGDWKQNSGGSRDIPRFKLKLGGTTLLDSGVTSALVCGNSTTRYSWRIEAEIQNRGATNSQWTSLNGEVLMAGTGTQGTATFVTGNGNAFAVDPAGGGARIDYIGGNASAVDTTAACALVLSVILPIATATIDLACYAARVELI